jgi:predicted dehydrogenase
MVQKQIAPVLVGQGMAGQAILKSLSIVSQMDPELNLLPARIFPRGDPPESCRSEETENVLFIANPSGLHAQFILNGAQNGFAAIAADKPVCVRPDEIPLLRDVPVPVTVFHGYRVMWGTRTIKEMIDAGELGEVFGFESRYWQSSSAQQAQNGAPEKRSWKNDLKLNGPSDTLTDLGSHVVDICLYLMGDKPSESKCWVSYQNAAAPFRDTHVHIFLKFAGDRRAMASISKIVHGATNDFEYTVLGAKGSATWRFLRPDEVEIGTGAKKSFIPRKGPMQSSGSSPFHGLGWLEGYVEITHQTLRMVSGLDSGPVPTLQEALAAMDVLLNAC